VSKYIEDLKKLKMKLSDGKMSVMVGAGFSKNANRDFKNWDELLFNLTLELYQDEIETKYSSFLNKSNTPKKKFIEKEVAKIIKREGYLELVSQYIKMKGYRESITTYIEEQYNHVDNSPNNDLTIHQLLMDIGWNNIYTTNYDTLIEKAVEEKLKKPKGDYEKKNEEYKKKKIKFEEKEEIFINLKREEEGREKSYFLNISKSIQKINTDIFSKKNGTSGKDKDASVLKGELDAAKQDFEAAKQELEEAERNLNAASERYSLAEQQTFTPVLSAKGLTIGKDKRLIKIHGSLRKDSKFGFDGDSFLNYIISREDYDEYPQKHEAFTQLMRISLLQESFCLVGFSGEDPNFKEWLKWVRDILVRDTDITKDEQKDYRIYLIDVGSEEISSDKELFYKNNRVTRIPLKKQEVKDFLKQHQFFLFPDKNEIKQNLVNLFCYLSDKLTLANEKKNQILRDLKEANFKFTLRNLLEYQKELKTLKRLDRIPPKKTSLFFPLGFREKFSTIYRQTKSGSQRLKLLSLLAGILQNNLSTIGLYFDIDKISFFVDDFKKIPYLMMDEDKKDDWLSFAYTVLLDARINNNKKEFSEWSNKIQQVVSNGAENRLEYESLQFAVQNFDYKQLEEGLNRWAPEENGDKRLHWIVKKAGLLSYINLEEAYELLRRTKENIHDEILQEQLYYYEVLKYFRFSLNNRNDEELDRKIKKIQNDIECTKIYDLTKFRVNDLLKKKETIKPLENGRYSDSITIRFSSTDDLFRVWQIVHLLYESGFPIMINNVTFISKEEWWDCFKRISNHYPHIALFYSFQLENSPDFSFLIRIAQSYINSVDLDNKNTVLLEIFRNLKKFYSYNLEKLNQNELGDFNNRYFQIKKTLVFLSEIFIALPLNGYESFFEQVWEDFQGIKLLKKELFLGEPRVGIQSFIRKALPFIEKKDLLRKIIIECLDYKEEESFSKINYLFEINKNPSFKKNKSYFRTKKLNGLVQNINSQLSSTDKPHEWLYLLSNIEDILSESNKVEALNELNRIEQFKVYSNQHWQIFVNFSRGNDKFQKKIKSGILKSKNIWPNGIEDTSLVFGDNYPVPFHKINRDNDNPLGLKWDDSELKKIFIKLKNSVEKIYKLKEKDFKLMRSRYIQLLYVMRSFLQKEKDYLENLSDYIDISVKVKKLFVMLVGYEDIIEGVVSNDSVSVIWSLIELRDKLIEKKEVPQNLEWQILLGKVLFKKQPKLELAIEYLSTLIDQLQEADWIKDKNYVRQYLLILKRYKVDWEELDIDRSFYIENLSRIAKVLKFWNHDNAYIDEWIDTKGN
jgi:hypothetical protein